MEIGKQVSLVNPEKNMEILSARQDYWKIVSGFNPASNKAWSSGFYKRGFSITIPHQFRNPIQATQTGKE